MAMVLPLLPNNFLEVGRQAVRGTMLNDIDGLLLNNIQSFCQYLNRQWMDENISVYGQQHRTNNAVESFHSRLSKVMGRQHPNIWVFITNLQKMEHTMAMDFTRVRRGEELPIRQRPHLIRMNQQIGKIL